MTLKTSFFTALFLAAAGSAQAQLAVGTAGLTVTAGTPLYVDGLAIQPSADLTLSGTTLQRSTATAIGVAGPANIKRVYEVSSPVAFSGTVTIYYNDSELNGNTEAALQLAYKTGMTWTPTTGATVNTAANTVSKPVTGLTFSKLTATSNATPLPVDLLSFTAHKTAAERQALLRWEVAAEEGLARYDVQRSADGKSFATIGSAAAASQPVYAFTDEQPTPGHNYYRLLLADASGSTRFSPVRLLSFGESTLQALLRVAPNPTADGVTVWVDASLLGEDVELTDATGRCLLRQTIASAAFPVDLTRYPKGLYLLRVASGPACKLVKQ